jgi:hypothetical protein
MKSPAIPGFECVDCRVNTNAINEYYMVNREVWLASGLKSNGGMLCIGCLEHRIGRELTRKDFTDAPINRASFFGRSARLLKRLNA